MTTAASSIRSPLVTLAVVSLLAAVFVAALYLCGDPLSTKLTTETFLYALGVIALTLPPAIVTALLLFRTNIVGRGVLHTLLIIWLFLPIYVHIGGWRDLFGPQGWLEIPNPLDPATNLIDGVSGVIFLHCLAAFPWVVFLTGVAFARGPASLEEDARLEASPLAVLTHVTLRRSWDAVLVAATWIVITLFGEMSIASVCNVRTYPEVVFTGIPLGLSIAESSLAIAPGAFLIVALVLLAAWLAETVRPKSSETEIKKPRRLPLKGHRAWCTALVWGIFLFALLPPIIGLVYKVGITVEQIDGQFVRGWSAMKALRLTLGSVAVYQTELTWSLLLGLSAAVTTTILGLLLSDFASRSVFSGRVISLLCGILFALPGPMVGIGLAWGTNQLWLSWLAPLFDQTLFVPTLAVLTITLPLVTFFYWHAMHGLRQIRELAALDGSSWWRTWTRIIIPGNVAAILAGTLIAFVLAINDVAASVLVLPAGIDTISRRIFGLLHFGGEDNVAGILLLNIACVAVLAVAIQRLAGWRDRSDSGDSLP